MSHPENEDMMTRPARASTKAELPGFEAELAHELAADLDTRLAPLRSVGMGGMGEVTEVDDRALHRRVAMKTLHVDQQEDARRRRMFVREARITGQLEHPNIVPVHELGMDPSGRLYFTMTYVEGRTLDDILAKRPDEPLGHSELLNLVDIVVRVCDALAYAHARGIVHCDVKTANVMVGDYGQVYLVDWGIAQTIRGEDAPSGPRRVHDGLTSDPVDREAVILGTACTMAPEQARGDVDRIDGRTDVFAVGAMLYQTLTGEPPYVADNLAARVFRAATGQYRPVEDSPRGRSAPPELARIIRKAMSIDAAERYASATELRNDLVRFVRGGAEFPTTRFEAGREIVREGDPGDAAYRIVEGRCDVFVIRDGVRSLVRTMGPGEIFGEMAILSPGPRTATVVAVTDVVVEVVTRQVLEHELTGLKPWMAALVRSLADRFRERDL